MLYLSFATSLLNVLILIFRVISIIIIGICLYVLYEWHLDNKANNSLQDDLSELIVVDVSKTSTENNDLPVINARFNNIKDENNKEFLVQDPDGYLLRFSEDLGTKDEC